MKNFFKILHQKINPLVFIYLIVLIIYFPSLFVFYTNDDFFHLKISEAESMADFFNFFNFARQPEGFGWYRPLTTQVFYFIGRAIFNFNPLPLHIITFFVFFACIYLVYKITSKLIKDKKTAYLAAFLYALTPIHFGHMYFLGTFQELGFTFFFLLAISNFLVFIKNYSLRFYFSSIVSFILALVCKETSVVLPGILLIIVLYKYYFQQEKYKLKEPAIYLIPYFAILSAYLFLHFFAYGFAAGDSYVWSFSPVKALNTLFWYVLWTLGLPEMLVDFVGNGLSINPNLFRFWGREIVTIFTLFAVFVSGCVFAAYKSIKSAKTFHLFMLSFAWFVIGLLPVLFLPLHKFSYLLTLPAIGAYLFIAYVVTEIKSNKFRVVFSLIFLLLSLATLKLSIKTHWITTGSKTARRVFDFVNANKNAYRGKTLNFYDQPEDYQLPWLPSLVLKQTLSDNNFFYVFYNGEIKATYGQPVKDGIYIKARNFLGY